MVWIWVSPNIAQHGPNLAQHSLNMAQHGPNLTPTWPKMASTSPNRDLIYLWTTALASIVDVWLVQKMCKTFLGAALAVLFTMHVSNRNQIRADLKMWNDTGFDSASIQLKLWQRAGSHDAGWDGPRWAWWVALEMSLRRWRKHLQQKPSRPPQRFERLQCFFLTKNVEQSRAFASFFMLRL